MIVRQGRYWVVVHCHGPDKGKVLGRHGTRAGALAQHRAIMASKARRRRKGSGGGRRQR